MCACFHALVRLGRAEGRPQVVARLQLATIKVLQCECECECVCGGGVGGGVQESALGHCQHLALWDGTEGLQGSAATPGDLWERVCLGLLHKAHTHTSAHKCTRARNLSTPPGSCIFSPLFAAWAKANAFCFGGPSSCLKQEGRVGSRAECWWAWDRHKSILWPAVCCGIERNADGEPRQKIPSHDGNVDLEEYAAGV